MTKPALPARPLRADLAAVYDHLRATFEITGQPPSHDGLIDSIRAAADRYAEIDGTSDLGMSQVIPARINGLQADWVVPHHMHQQERILYLHGGGWIAGSLHCFHPLAAQLAIKTGRAVLLLDYALAPERPFPAGLLDCGQALQWIWRHGPHGSEAATNLALMGDSAGGNLAAALCINAAHQGWRQPNHLVLLSPSLDTTPGSRPPQPMDPVCNALGMAAAMAMYVQDGTPLTDPRISPLHASNTELSALPPLLVQASGAEYLYPDAVRFVQRVLQSGRRAKLSTWQDMPHVWHAFLNLLPEAGRAVDEIAAFLSSASTD